MSRPRSRQIKNQLFLKCGRVDMYNMQKYALDNREEYNHRMEIIKQNKKILEKSRD